MKKMIEKRMKEMMKKIIKKIMQRAAFVFFFVVVAGIAGILLQGCITSADKNNSQTPSTPPSVSPPSAVSEENISEPSPEYSSDYSSEYSVDESALAKAIIKTSSFSDSVVDVIIFIEIAGTPEEREKGLMFRTKDSFPEDRGMLFIYERPSLVYYWMRNMSFPIDIMFIDDFNRIVYVYKNLPPCTEEMRQCPLYSSVSSATYVLEVNAGFIDKNGISINDEVVFIEAGDDD